MKNLIAFLVLFILTLPALAQRNQTLIRGRVDSGGFGGPVVKFSSFNGDPAAFVGGRGGWILNFRDGQTFILGGGGYGLVSEHKTGTATVFEREPLYYNVGYGGFELEYINHTRRLIHAGGMVLIGGGAINYRDNQFDTYGKDDPFFVVEPGLHLELNVTDFFRIAGGASYRFTTGVSLDQLDDDDLSGPSGMLTFKFGKF